MNTIDIKTLLPELKKLVSDLSEDMLKRVSKNAEINDGLKHAYQQIEKGGRTAQAYEVWLEDYLDQVAVAWVLSCVFVRFMEDNGLIDECWLAGEGERRKRAEDAHTLYFREHPHESDREYFEHVFKEVGKIPAAADLFAEGKTPLWAVGPTGDAARKLLRFWREMDTDSGHLIRSFQVESGDTRFLGDLYQELSERAKDKFALLQTPVFVEEFILDYTLTPAIAEFGLKTVRLIDPTCGSGHFLLGAFDRLFAQWSKPEYTSGNAETDTQHALDGVWGVDINPFAVAIARFRLIVAAVQVCGITRLKKAPGWTIHLATGDSLLFGSRWERNGEKRAVYRYLDESWAPEIYACEDKKALQEVFGQQYHVVVGNPPYIAPGDTVLAKEYRKRYKAAFNRYHLSTPFTERFFEIAIANADSTSSGFVGLIKDKAFSKREFGKKLIEECLPSVDLTHVADCEGAYIPGHGTPTVILFGRNRPPSSKTVRAVLGIKGEPGTPADPSRGLVWQSILRNIQAAGRRDEFTSSSDVPRESLGHHPWSIGGGGASELKEKLDGAAVGTVGDYSSSVGITAVTGEDDAYVFASAVEARRFGLHNTIGLIMGDMVRDHIEERPLLAVWPYDEDFRVRPLEDLADVNRILWPFRVILSQRRRFGTPMLEKGASWHEWQELYYGKLKSPLALVFGEVATHNHFVLDHGGKVFNRTAPIIKLPVDASMENHVAMLGRLVSSVVCFWLKQVSHNKGDSTDQHGARTTGDPAFNTYQFNSKRVAAIPLCKGSPIEYVKELIRLANEYVQTTVQAVVDSGLPTRNRLDEAHAKADALLGEMIACQEELDWYCYELYGLLSDSMCYEGSNLPRLQLGERAFEIDWARKIARGDVESAWFQRHGSTPITEIPANWSDDYRKLIQRRMELIETNNEIGLIEKPEHKRRWNFEPWENQERRVLRDWLLERLESHRYWPDPETNEPKLQTTAELTDKATGDEDFNQVAALYRGRSDFDLAALVAELIESESVPFLPIQRYRAAGLRKRALWEQTWVLQRREDAGEDVGEIPVPPKYTNSSGKQDYQKPDYWRLRGSLDLPRERWISYPNCERDGDQSLVIGWAGWNHLQQATALVAYYDARKREGWTADRLKPILAGLDQLLPWIHQWHPEIDPDYGETAGQSFQNLLESDAHELGLTLDEIRSWKPPTKTTTRGRKSKA